MPNLIKVTPVKAQGCQEYTCSNLAKHYVNCEPFTLHIGLLVCKHHFLWAQEYLQKYVIYISSKG